MVNFIVIAILILLWAVWMLSFVTKHLQKWMGHDRCYSCKSKLKYANGYASVCAKCGRAQPWAQ